jgi:hypothetical protein
MSLFVLGKKRVLDLEEVEPGVHRGKTVGPAAGKYNFELQIDKKSQKLVPFEVLESVSLAKTTVTGNSYFLKFSHYF